MNKKPAILSILVIILKIILSGYSSSVTLKADETGATPEGVKSVVNANNKFAFELYSKFKKETQNKSNIFFSPYSISVALSMTYEGARNQTAKEMQSVLHIPMDDNIRRTSFVKIYNEINRKDKKYKLSTANALWAQKDYKFLKEYTDIVEKYYCGKVTNLDFIKESENSRLKINEWVEGQTNNKIKDLIPHGGVNQYTRLVLTNAIYFKGTWVKQFDKKETKEEDFKTNSGKILKVPMMSLTGNDAEFNYTETDKFQIIEMPYDGKDLSMLILLPKQSMKDFEESINTEILSEWKNMLRKQRVEVYIPKFKFETKYFMNETLKEMGMPTAFTDGADFSGMGGSKSLSINNVIHQAFVEVNEEGTEAAAATGVIVGITSVGLTVPVFRADHPFIFMIQQIENGNILFLGKVIDPTK